MFGIFLELDLECLNNIFNNPNKNIKTFCAIAGNDLDVGKMSDYIEIIHPQSMTAKLLCNGVMVEEYKIEQCDKCSQLRRLDHFGYQKGYDKQDNIIWFCGDCR
jgi:hypothetical protein